MNSRIGPRRLLPLGALLLGSLQLAGCGPSRPEGWLSEPPLPEALAEIEEDVVNRIQTAADLVREDPEPALPWGDLGKTYEVVGLRLQAIECYEQAQLRDPADPKWWYRSGVCRGRMQDMAGAIEDMRRVSSIDGSYAPAFYRRGTYSLESGDLTSAEEAFRQALAVSEEFMGGWVGMARVHLLRDENQEAVEILEAQHRRDEKDTSVSKLLQTAYRQAGIDREVSGADGVEEDENEPGGRFWIDPWQVELRSYRRAPEAHRMARMLERGKADQVINALEKRRLDDPEATDFLPQLAEAYFQVGRSAEARATYRDLIAKEPDNIPARLALARFQEAEGMPHLAVNWLDEIIEIDPTFGPAWATKGSILVAGDQFHAAVPVLQKAVALDQRNPRVWQDLGRAQMIAKDWPGAVTSFENFLEHEPEDGKSRLSLAKALAKTGDYDRAAETLESVRALGSEQPGRMAEVEKLIERGRSRKGKNR